MSPTGRFFNTLDLSLNQHHTHHKAFVGPDNYLVLRLLTSFKKRTDKVSFLRHDVHGHSRMIQPFS